MSLVQSIPTGATCFIDANVLAYAMTDAGSLSVRARELMTRVESGEIAAFCTLGVICDAVHAMMLAEAVLRLGLEPTGVSRQLRGKPQVLGKLSTFAASAEAVLRSRLGKLSVDEYDVLEATRLSREHGLLMNDALIAALMLRHSIRCLCTNDNDFDALPALDVWKPR